MKIVKVFGFLVLIGFGAFMMAFGQADDSPGAGGIGLLSIIMGVIGIYKQIRKT